MAYNGETCPKCDSPMQIISDRPESSSTMQMYQEVRCLGCGTRYNETYTLTNLFEVDDEGHEGKDHMTDSP